MSGYTGNTPLIITEGFNFLPDRDNTLWDRFDIDDSPKCVWRFVNHTVPSNIKFKTDNQMENDE